MCSHSASVTRSHHRKSLPNTCSPPMFLPPRPWRCLMRPTGLPRAAHKARLRALGSGLQALTMTATPIPRRRWMALLSLQDPSESTSTSGHPWRATCARGGATGPAATPTHAVALSEDAARRNPPEGRRIPDG
ncbi:hypothetical protein DDV93_03455 [Cereibacter johrii]|nr:hypothetical protein DDV93_03455 [Cereibacter johrii]